MKDLDTHFCMYRFCFHEHGGMEQPVLEASRRGCLRLTSDTQIVELQQLFC